MNKLLIYQYINKLTSNDIKEFGLKQNIALSDEEIATIYDYIKHKTEKIFTDPLQVIEEIKDHVSTPVYNKLLELYQQYKNIIKTSK